MLFYNFLIYTTIQSMNANVKNIPSPVSSFVCLFSVLKNYHFNPQVIIGCLGNIGNLISIVVLSTSEMRNSFNLLLIFLAVRKQSDDIPEFIQGIQTLDFQCFSKSMMLIWLCQWYFVHHHCNPWLQHGQGLHVALRHPLRDIHIRVPKVSLSRQQHHIQFLDWSDYRGGLWKVPSYPILLLV